MFLSDYKNLKKNFFGTTVMRIVQLVTDQSRYFNPSKCKALPALGRSDHDTVQIDLALTAHQQCSSPRKILLWNKADKSIIGSHIQYATEKIMRTQYTSVNDIWNPKVLLHSEKTMASYTAIQRPKLR